ncbi:MAG: HAD hydrolase-like protein [Desulfobacterales bacterium]|nr:MAG: HAD hydrolase-like protein [Desulfobacterales bacterium]
MKDLRVVAFDCDGVLFDTEQSNRAYYNEILNHFGKPTLTPEQFAYVHMHTLEDSLAYLFNDKKSLAQAYAYRKTMDYRKFFKLMKLEPELVSLLKKIRPRIKTAIATNRTDTVNWLLNEFNLNGYFDLVVTSSDVQFPKPHPDPLLKILAYFQIEPYQAIYVGDSYLDELAATSAGMPLVAYRNPRLSSACHIESLKELETILDA